MARYPGATWRPTSKHGYGGNDTHLHQGLVIHSAEGSLVSLFSVLDGSRQASWHFSMAQDGRVFQHVDTANIAWTNGSPEANTKFWGIECEGGGPGNPGEPLTEPQYQALVGVVRWLWGAHGLTRYERQRTLWEHRELTRFGAAPTSCPSGRIPWQRLIVDLQEDDMPSEAWFFKYREDLVRLVTAEMIKVREDGAKAEKHLADLRQQELLAAIGAGGSGGGSSPDAIADKLAQRLQD